MINHEGLMTKFFFFFESRHCLVVRNQIYK